MNTWPLFSGTKANSGSFNLAIQVIYWNNEMLIHLRLKNKEVGFSLRIFLKAKGKL